MNFDVQPPLFQHLLKEAKARKISVKMLMTLILQGKETIPPFIEANNTKE